MCSQKTGMEIDIPALFIAAVVTVVWLMHILLTLAKPEFGHFVLHGDSESEDSDAEEDESLNPNPKMD